MDLIFDGYFTSRPELARATRRPSAPATAKTLPLNNHGRDRNSDEGAGNSDDSRMTSRSMGVSYGKGQSAPTKADIF